MGGGSGNEAIPAEKEDRMDLKKTRFTEMLIQANGLDATKFQQWAFCPGMRFNSPDKWWGDGGRRAFPHEGTDFCLYTDPSGQLHRLAAATRIPVMHSGVVRAVFSDYLGQAIILEHPLGAASADTFLAAYAHTTPLPEIQPGRVVTEGEVIALIAATDHLKTKILPHLHLTLGRPRSGLTYQGFVWNRLRDPDLITLLDPETLIDWPCRVIDSGVVNAPL